MVKFFSNRVRGTLTAVAASVILGISAGGGLAAAGDTGHSEARAALERGEEALRGLDYSRALGELDRAVANNDLEPAERAVALLNRGLARQNLRDNEGAIADYSEALQIGTLPAPARAIAYFNRGLAQNAVGKTTLALEDLSSAIRTNPAFAQAYNSRGTLMRMLGRNEEAVQDYQAAIKNRYPQPHLAYYGQALSYIELRQLAQARKALSSAIDANPRFNMARDKLAEIGATITPVNDTPTRVVEVDTTTTGGIGGQPPEESRDTLEGADLKVSKAKLEGYLVQLMAQRDRNALVDAWDHLFAKHAAVLGDLKPVIQQADLGSRGTMFRLRTGPFEDRDEAEKVCNALKRRGAACFTTSAKN